MAFNVLLHSYAGIIQVRQIAVRQYNSDSMFMLEEPYIDGQFCAVPNDNSGANVISVPNDDPKQTILRVEVPDSQKVRYEVILPGYPVRVAGGASPGLSGIDYFNWGPGYRLALADASAFAA